MDDLAKAAGNFFFAAALVCAATIAGTLMGAFSGWLVGLFFRQTMAVFFGALGLGAMAPWQIGAMLGFAGAFFHGPRGRAQ